MNIFKLILQSIRLKLYVCIAKSTLKLIQYFDKHKKQLLEIMTMYNVEDKLVELKTPIYEYYYAYKNISIGETLKNEILEKDIPTGVNIKTIYNPSYIKDEGYYCIINKKREYFGILNSEKHPFENPSENEVFIELFDDNTPTQDGYYQRTITTYHYYYAKNKIFTTKIELADIVEDERMNIKLINDISNISETGYYKIIK